MLCAKKHIPIFSIRQSIRPFYYSVQFNPLITDKEYNQHLKFARNLIRSEGYFLLNEYDLVHDAICASVPDIHRGIMDAFYSEKRKSSVVSSLVVGYAGNPTVSGIGSRKKLSGRADGEKICSRCQASLPVSYFYQKFDKEVGRHFLRSMCILCERARCYVYGATYREERINDPVYKARRSETMRRHWRKMVQDKDRLKAHNEVKNANRRRRLENDPGYAEVERARGRKHYHNNKEAQQQRSRQKYLKKKARMEADPAYRDKVLEAERNRQARRLKAMSPEERKVFNRKNYLQRRKCD